MKLGFGTNGVRMRRDFAGDAHRRAAYGRLLREVLGPNAEPASAPEPWHPEAFFSPDGRCVAGLEIGLLPLVLDNEQHLAAGIRSAATARDWRGRGLFRQLMKAALDWCEGHPTAVTMLYTETPSLYERFGFRPVPQHAFTGPAPALSADPPDRQPVFCKCTDHQAFISEVLARRAPVSSRCALLVDAPLFLANVAKDETLKLLYAPKDDVLIVYEQDGDQIIIVDIVASQIPTVTTIVQSLLPEAKRVQCLFPPDRLEWDGRPEKVDTGLMIRGTIPPAMQRPFMFPPTSEF